MKQLMKKGMSLLLAFVLILGLVPAISLTADAATVEYRYSSKGYIYNWGTREEVATFLSPNAESFYTKNNVTLESLSDLSGSSDFSSLQSSALYTKLCTLMSNAHTYETSYDATRSLFQYTDCQGSARTNTAISCFYTGGNIGPSWDSGSTWNREHTWPNSKSSNLNNEDDIMMLRPTSSRVNSSRGNKAYGQSSGYYNPNVESNGKHNLHGDVARIVLYVYVRWGKENSSLHGNLWGSTGVFESKELLLDWMEEDPVDTWELGRNDSVESITGTRNVFVDFPELAFLLFDEQVPAMQTPSGSGGGQTPDTGITIDSQPVSLTVNEGEVANFTVAATGTKLTYQWQYRTSETDTWKNSPATGNKTATLSVPGTLSRNGYQYRCVITNGSGSSLYSDAATLTVCKPGVELAKPGLRLALESDLSAGFTVKPAMFADGAYTDLRMEFRLGDENAEPVVVTDYITLSNGDRVYMFDGIAPRMLNETIYATLYGTYMGTEYSVSVSTSIYAYCNWALSGSDAKLKKLVVDLMNYASAHQIYGNYKTDTLANRNLSPEQQALGTQTDPARTNITNASQVVIANPTASFTGAALYLQNKVEIRFTFSVPALTENTRLVVEVDGQKVTYGADKFVATGNKYYVDVDALAAKQMRAAVDATLYEGNTAISNTLRYSIESFVAYAYGREGFSTEALDAMMIAMLKYGDSANAFFN